MLLSAVNVLAVTRLRVSSASSCSFQVRPSVLVTEARAPSILNRRCADQAAPLRDEHRAARRGGRADKPEFMRGVPHPVPGG